MAEYLGDFKPGDTIRFRFNTRTLAQVPITFAGSPVLSIYKDGGTTESTAGTTLTVDFDSRTGLHLFAIDTSADGSFYSSGSMFSVVVTAGTVDGQSVVGETVREFSLGLGNKDANVVQISGDSVAADNAEAFFDGTGYAGTNNVIPLVTTTTNLTNLPSIPASWLTSIWSHATRTLTAISDSSGVATLLTRIVGTLASGTHQPQSGDSFARIGANGAGLTSIGDTRLANLDATVSSRATQTSVDDIPTTSEIVTAIAGWQPAWALGDDFESVLQSIHDETEGVGSRIVSIDAIADKLDTMLELDGLVYRFTTNALEQAPSGGGSLTAADVWDYLIAGSPAAGSAGAALAAAGSAGDPWSTLLPGSYTAGQAGYILDAIADKTGLIVVGSVTYTSPVQPSGHITAPIFIGDDYKASIGRAFEWTINARSGYVVGTASCRFGGSSDTTTTVWNVTGTVSDLGGGQWKLSFDLPKATTGALQAGFYRWSVELINAGGDEVTEVFSSTANRMVEVRSKQT